MVVNCTCTFHYSSSVNPSKTHAAVVQTNKTNNESNVEREKAKQAGHEKPIKQNYCLGPHKTKTKQNTHTSSLGFSSSFRFYSPNTQPSLSRFLSQFQCFDKRSASFNGCSQLLFSSQEAVVLLVSCSSSHFELNLS